MDGRRFDDLARDLTSWRTRRGLLGDLAGGTLAGALGGVGLSALIASETSAKKKKRKKKKKKCKGSSSCGTGQLCVLGKCVTGAGTCPDGASICNFTPYTDNCNGNPDCNCYTKVGGGTRCGTKVSACGSCTQTEECAQFGVGSVCAVALTNNCGCTAGQGFCITPCAS